MSFRFGSSKEAASSKEEAPKIWIDRARWAGVPIFTMYTLTSERIYVKTGIFNLREEELLLYRVLDITLRQSLLERILGLGTVLIYAVDATDPVLALNSIKNPRNVRQIISELVESRRRESGIRGKEMFGATV